MRDAFNEAENGEDVLIERHGKQYTLSMPGGSTANHRPARKPINKDTKDYSLCPHGQVKGFCKKGCK